MRENGENKPRNSDFTRRIKRVEETYLVWLSKEVSRHFNGGELWLKEFSGFLGESELKEWEIKVKNVVS